MRLALRVPSGTPKVALRSETGMLSMKLRIWKKKLMFLHHISGLKEDVLAKKVWEQQKTRNWPGLVAEGQAIFKELGLDEEGMQECSKSEWRMKGGEACAAKDEKFMLEEIRSKSKLEEIKNEGVGIKPYMGLKPLNQVRDLFRIRTCMVKGFKANFGHKEAVCEECGGKTDTQSHAMECPGYEDMREGLDLNQDIDLVKYFRNVLKRRGL